LKAARQSGAGIRAIEQIRGLSRIGVVAAAVALSGCADFETRSAPVTSISAQDYEHYECNQIATEARAVAQRAARLWRVEPGPNRADTVIMLWPASTFFGDRSTGNELQRLRVEFEAMRQASAAKDCPLALKVQSG
jgi:hypothetical protein